MPDFALWQPILQPDSNTFISRRNRRQALPYGQRESPFTAAGELLAIIHGRIRIHKAGTFRTVYVDSR